MLLGEPVAVGEGDVVVSGDSSFDAGEVGGPLVELFAGVLQRDAEPLPEGSEVGDVKCCNGVEYLAVDFPGDIAFEEAHGFSFTLALGPARSRDIAKPRPGLRRGETRLRIDAVAAAQAQANSGALIIDTRKQLSWNHGHIKVALHLPADSLDAQLATLPRDQTLILYGWGPGCNGATHTARRLIIEGFNVR